MDNSYELYWTIADEALSELLPRVQQQIQRLYSPLQDISDIYGNIAHEITPYRKTVINNRIDEWREHGYWCSLQLEANSLLIRRRQYAEAEHVLALMVLAQYSQTYSRIWDMVRPIYEDLFRDKYFNYVKNDFEGALPIIQTVDGQSPLEQLQNEAAYRARMMSARIAGLNADEGWDGDIVTPIIAAEMAATLNRLLQQTSKGGWMGILDTMMCLYIANAVIEAGKVIGGKYKFHAVLDKDTTKVCRALNGKVFDVEDMVIGINLPPVVAKIPHPCRSWITFV